MAVLNRSAAAWGRLPPGAHLLAVLLLMLLALLRWQFLRSPSPLGDESLYLQAFEISRAGGTPYDVEGYFYPRVFARSGALVLEVLGSVGTLAALRGANLLGLASAFWVATAWLPLPIARRWLAAAAVLCLSPAVHAGLDLGNVSFFIVGLTLMALYAWPRRPLMAGALLGVSVALKPIAAAVIPILLVHRPRRGPGHGGPGHGGPGHGGPGHGGGRHLSAAVTAAAIAAVLLLPISDLREMLGQEMVELSFARSFSLRRLFALFGVDLPQIVLTLAGTAVATAAARARPISSAQLLCYAVAAVSLVTPLVWSHTLIIALPVQGLALVLARQRLAEARAGNSHDRRLPTRRRYELICVALGVAMMHAGTSAGFDHLRPAIQAVFLIAVGLTPAVVCAYAFGFTEAVRLPRKGAERESPAAGGRSRPRGR